MIRGVIFDLDGVILSTDDFGAMLNGCVPGQSIELTVWKHGKKTTMNVLVEHKSH